MDEITLNNHFRESATYIPNEFIDSYMTGANGEYVKIYLYLLRCMNRKEEELTISRIADHFDHTEKDVHRALKYWEKVHLLRLEYDSTNRLSGICLLPGEESAHARAASDGEKPSGESTFSRSSGASNPRISADDSRCGSEPRTDALQTDPEPGADSLRSNPKPVVDFTRSEPKPGANSSRFDSDSLEQFQQKAEIRELIFLAETYLKRTISRSDLQFIFTWYDNLHFSTELIEYLIESCIAKGHSSLHYMQKVAEDWHNKGIRTPAQAKQMTAQHSDLYFSVLKAFGIRGRNLVPSEEQFLHKWQEEYGFSKEMICEACSRTIQNIHQASFEYADTILKNWLAAGIQNPQDLEQADALRRRERTARTSKSRPDPAKPGKFSNFQQRDYDYEQLTKTLLEKSMQ